MWNSDEISRGYRDIADNSDNVQIVIFSRKTEVELEIDEIFTTLAHSDRQEEVEILKDSVRQLVWNFRQN